MYLIFDTETSGFPSNSLPATSQTQARVIQLAAIKLDENFKEVASINTLIKPPSWLNIQEGAFKAHGISKERCEKEGKEQKEVMADLQELVKECNYLIAHNIAFDKQMLEIEICHCDDFMMAPDEICTMELMTPICRLPHKTHRNFGSKYKWPKLQEAYQFIFKKPFAGKEHDGMSDCRACKDIFLWLIDKGYVNDIVRPSGTIPASSNPVTILP